MPEKLAEAEAAAAGETEAEEAMGGARDSGGRWLNGGAEAQEVGVDEGTGGLRRRGRGERPAIEGGAASWQPERRRSYWAGRWRESAGRVANLQKNPTGGRARCGSGTRG